MDLPRRWNARRIRRYRHGHQRDAGWFDHERETIYSSGSYGLRDGGGVVCKRKGYRAGGYWFDCVFVRNYSHNNRDAGVYLIVKLLLFSE